MNGGEAIAAGAMAEGIGGTVCGSRADPSIVPLTPQQLLHQHHYNGNNDGNNSKPRYGSPLYRSSPELRDLCCAPLESLNGRELERGMGMQRGIPALKLDDFHPMQQQQQPRMHKVESLCVPALRLDDFNVGFASGGGYGGGNEWMDLMSDLQPCESTESSALPVVVDAWESDFTLPRELRVRVSDGGEDAALALQRAAGLQHEEYEMQYRLRTLQQLGHAGPHVVQEEPSFDASAHTERTHKEMETEERETESDYSGGLDKDQSVHLVHLLLECAECIEKNHHSAFSTLRHLRDLSSPYGDPMQRVAAYFCDALTKRLARARGEAAAAAAPEAQHIKDSLVACQVLNDVCPYLKFAHLTANQAILEAVEGCEALHILDFGVTHGVQWAALLQAFASRPKRRPPPRLRITGIGAPEAGSDGAPSLLATGKRLQSFAEILNVKFEFCPVVARMEDVDLAALRLDSGETLVVNFMLQLHQLLGGAVDRLLKSVASLRPVLVTLTEYDAALNGAAFRPRFMDALHFYCAVFDSLDATMPRDCPDRLSVEGAYFAREIESIVACEGAARTERHESTERWIALLQAAGFACSPLSHYAHSQAQQLLWQYCDSFRLHKTAAGCLSLTWQDRSLLTVSAWKCS